MEPITAAAGLTALKLAKELTPLVTSLRKRVPTALRDSIQELSDKVFEVQTEVLSAREREIQLTDRCRKLEDDLKRVQDWEAVKARYALTKIADRFFVYSLKPECAEGDPSHWLCEKCFVDRRPSILQGLPDGAWQCSNCGNTHCEPRLRIPI